MFSIDICFWLHTGWAPSLWLITCLLGGCRIIHITNNSTSTNTNAPNKRNKSESRTTCEREKWDDINSKTARAGSSESASHRVKIHSIKYRSHNTLILGILRLRVRTIWVCRKPAEYDQASLVRKIVVQRGNYATSLPGSLIFPSSLAPGVREDERPW